MRTKQLKKLLVLPTHVLVREHGLHQRAVGGVEATAYASCIGTRTPRFPATSTARS